MGIGYACLTIGVRNTDQRSCILKNATTDKLKEIIIHNLNSLEHIIDYNIQHEIKIFRISSDLIPFGSSFVNDLKWWELYESQFQELGAKIKGAMIRVSMHPGQYTVLNSNRKEVVERAILDLQYHARVLDSLGVEEHHKIVLHIGGIYGDKKQAMQQFINNYHHLDEGVKKRLVLENDDKSYHIGDLLEIAKILKTPIIFDNLHNKINPYDTTVTEYQWIKECEKTWREQDGNQKIHYSQQNFSKKAGSHSTTIRIKEFMDFYHNLENKDIDIMLEVKDKNLSAIKCINCVKEEKMQGCQNKQTRVTIKELENEWSRYKYTVLEHSHTDYLAIRTLFREQYFHTDMSFEEEAAEAHNVLGVTFYDIIERALEQTINIGEAVNAASHVWGYFKDLATEQEKKRFMEKIEKYQRGQISIETIKNTLWKLTVKYQQKYLMDSLYFYV